jgi:competence protein ComEC
MALGAAAAARRALPLLAVGRLGRRLHDHLTAERGRWFLWVPVGFGTGISTYFALGFEPALPAALLLGLAAVSGAYLWRAYSLAQLVSPLLLAVVAGVLVAKVNAELSRAPMLERRLHNVEVVGIIERVEPRSSRGPRLTLRVLRLAKLPPELTPYRVRVRLMKPAANLSPGVAVTVQAVLAPPSRPALPGGYDFARSAYFQRIGGIGYAFKPPVALEPQPQVPFLLAVAAALQRLRNDIGARITTALPGETGAIATALMTGERGAITPGTLEAYRDSGLLHILSISGLHMAIMGGSVFFGLRLLLAAMPGTALRHPIKKWSAVGAIVAAFLYLMISGATHATQRAFIMLLIMMFAIICDRPAIAVRNVAIAALLILLWSPASLLNVGFQMSFAAVLALVATYEALRDRRRGRTGDVPRGTIALTALFFAGIVGTTVVASLAVAPIGAFHFHKSQQYAVLANLIAVPVCNFIVMPMALLSFLAMPLGLEFIPLWLMGIGIDLMTWSARQVAALPGAVGHIPAFPTAAFALMILGGLWLCLWRTAWRLWGLALIVAGLLIAPLQARPDIMIGREGRLVAVRQPDGGLVALDSRGARFELQRWLEYDGDAREPGKATDRSAFRCDDVGCNFRKQGMIIAVSRSPASLADDCERAGLLVLRYPKPPACTPQGPVLDFWQLRDGGTHLVYLQSGGWPKVESVAATRGVRPWTNPARPRSRLSRLKPNPDAGRIAAFAAQRTLQARPLDQLRPEVEDDPFDGWND